MSQVFGTYNSLICPNLVDGYTSTASSATPITLTSSSTKNQHVTGSVAQSVVLPPANNPALTNGYDLAISNRSTNTITVFAPGAINGLTATAYTFPLTTITVASTVGTFPPGGGTFLLVTTSGLQTITYTTFSVDAYSNSDLHMLKQERR